MPNPHLSKREVEALHYASQGHTAEVAAQLHGISRRTEEEHRANAMRKLGRFSLVAACCDAVRLGLIPAFVGLAAWLMLPSEPARIMIEEGLRVRRVLDDLTDRDEFAQCEVRLFWFEETPTEGVKFCDEVK